jgi:2-oxoglutarate dehydrogenase complex dehydrogenase (E1) component-like enzyme
MLSHLLLLRPGLAPHGARAFAGKVAGSGSDWRPMPIHPMPPLDGESGTSGSSSLCEMEAEWKYEIHADAPRQTYQESMKLMLLVRAFQQCGHFAAQVRGMTLPPAAMACREWTAPPHCNSPFQVDPLGVAQQRWAAHSTLDPAFYGFEEADLDRG